MPGQALTHAGWMAAGIQIMLTQYGPVTAPSPHPAITNSVMGPPTCPNNMAVNQPIDNLLAKPTEILNPPPAIVGQSVPLNGGPLLATPAAATTKVIMQGAPPLIATGMVSGNMGNSIPKPLTPTMPTPIMYMS